MREATVLSKATHFENSVTGIEHEVTDRQTPRWIGWIPLAVFPILCIAICSAWASWIFMWLLALTIFAGCKWQTWWDAQRAGASPSWARSAAYLLLWPGMDAGKFLDCSLTKPRVPKQEWLSATLKTVIGAALIFVAGNDLIAAHPLWAAWTGMLGLVFFLHFGAFYLIALAWQSLGICAEPIMRRPLASKSLSEFWGKRWNLGFRALSHKLVFRPLKSRYGAAVGTLCAFLVSGLIHDLVVSVPARGGYGLPTAYFLIQGIGVLAERSRVGKPLGMGSGTTGRMWTILITAGPIVFLFHPWFITRVMLPFLRVI